MRAWTPSCTERGSTVIGAVNGDSQDGEDRSLATSDKRGQAPSPHAVSASMADKGLEVLRKHQSSLNSTSTPRGSSHSGRRLPPTGDRAPPHLPISLATCWGLLLVNQLQTDWQGLSCAWIISPCCSTTQTQIVSAAKEPLSVPRATIQLQGQGGISTISPLKEKGSERHGCWSITGCAAGVATKTWLLQPQDTL